MLRGYDGEEIARRRKAGMGSWAGKITVLDDKVFDPMTDAEIAEAFGEDFLALVSLPHDSGP